MDGGAWWATVHGVAKNRTRLSDFTHFTHMPVCAQAWKPGSQHAGEKRGVAGLLLGRTERAARAAELQLCAQARERTALAERLLWPGRASPSASQLLASSPGKEQAAGVWETCLAPGWPQLRSRLPFGPRSQASLQKAQGPSECTGWISLQSKGFSRVFSNTTVQKHPGHTLR